MESTGTLALNSSSFTANTASFGGAISAGSDVTAAVAGTTFTSNKAQFAGAIECLQCQQVDLFGWVGLAGASECAGVRAAGCALVCMAARTRAHRNGRPGEAAHVGGWMPTGVMGVCGMWCLPPCSAQPALLEGFWPPPPALHHPNRV